MGGSVVVLGSGGDDRDWRIVRRALPAGWKDAAWDCRALRWNKGPLADPEMLLRVLLGLAASDYSVRQTATHARLTRLVHVSYRAIHKRLTRSADWFEWIVRAMLRDSIEPLPTSPLRLRLLDATCVSKPGSTGTDFRLHVNVSLPARQIADADVTGAEGGESLNRFRVEPGDVMVGDRGYGTASGIAHVHASGGYTVVRINASNLPLFSLAGVRIDPLKTARKLRPGAFFEAAVQIFPNDAPSLCGRLCVYALTDEQALKAQRRARNTKVRKQKRIGRRAIESARYVFVFTTLPGSFASTMQVCSIYRLRWQVELAFKTLKSVCGLSRLPHRQKTPGRAWLLAKLLCALIAERLATGSQAFPPDEEISQAIVPGRVIAFPHDGLRAPGSRSRAPAPPATTHPSCSVGDATSRA
jgi:hypothetical protein